MIGAVLGVGFLPLVARAKDDIGVHIPSKTRAQWAIKIGSYVVDAGSIGGLGETPIVGDFDGDGRDDIGVYIPGKTKARWAIKSLADPNRYIIDIEDIGGQGQTPIVGDFLSSTELQSIEPQVEANLLSPIKIIWEIIKFTVKTDPIGMDPGEQERREAYQRQRREELREQRRYELLNGGVMPSRYKEPAETPNREGRESRHNDKAHDHDMRSREAQDHDRTKDLA